MKIFDEKDYCYIIAEIGNNHQGDLETALKMIEVASSCGVDAVKFQKRNNRALYTTAYYNRDYNNPDSYGRTYGEHRDYLEFDEVEYRELIACAEGNNVDFLVTAFDFESVDFLEKLNIKGYKIASGDVTNTPLLKYIGKLGKPIIISTGAATLDEVRMAYKTVIKINKKLAMLHCTAAYPADYSDLNLIFIEKMTGMFPDAVIGYSGHDNGILAGVIACMLGARVIEKHFTLNRALKGTDHKFSLEPEGLRKQVRDIRRIRESMGCGEKIIMDSEMAAREKMGKGVYSSRKIKAGSVISKQDIVLKSPSTELMPYMIDYVIGKTLKKDLSEDSAISQKDLE